MGVLSGYKSSGRPAAQPSLSQLAQMAGFQPNLTPEQIEAEKPKSVGGFIGNIFGDIKEIGQGLTSLVSMTGSDAWDAIREGATLGQAETDGYNWAEVGRTLPAALKGDYAERYGFEGGEAVGERLYEDPLSYVGDALTVLTAGGYAAAKGAQVASKVPSVSAGLRALGQGSDNVSGVVKAVDRILPGLKNDEWAAGTRQVVNPRTQRVQTIDRAFNPARRVWSEQVTQRMLSRPVSALQREVAELEGRVMLQGGPELAESALKNSLTLKQNALRLAEEAGGAPILRDRVADFKVAKLTNTLLGKHGGAHVQGRDAMKKEFAQTLKGLDDADSDRFITRAQIDLPEWAGSRMSFDAIRTMTAATNKESELWVAIQDDLKRIAGIEKAMLTRDISTVPPALIRQARGDLKDAIKKAQPELRPHELRAAVDAALPGRVWELLPTEYEMARRYVEWLSEGAVGDKLGYVDATSQVLDDMRLVTHKNLTNEYLNAGGTYRTVFERALKPLNKVKNDTWDFDAPEAALALDDELMATGLKAPLYVPHIESLNLKVSDFLMPWRMSGMRRAAEGGRKGFKRSEGEVFERWLKGVKDAAITDPLEAYSRRSAEIARHKEAIYFLRNLADEVGRPIEAMDDLAEWETVLNLDGAQMLIRKRMELGDAIAGDEMDVGGMSGAVSSAAEAALRSLPDEVAEVFGRAGALYAVPKTVAEQVEKLMHFRMGYKARLFFDGPLNAWRNLALYLRPAFYINNMMGNSVFLKLQGGSLGSVLRQAVDPKYRALVREFLGENLDDVERTGFFDHTLTRANHFGKNSDKLGAQLTTAVKESKVGRGTGRVRDLLQHFNGVVEDAFRREAYMTAAQKSLALSNVNGVGRPFLKSYRSIQNMMEHGADPQKMAKWLDETNAVMNDYSALSPFERNVIRRTLIPFWPFYKHATKTLFRMPFDHPIKADVLRHLGDLSREMSQEQLGPEIEPWLEGMFPVGMNGEDTRVFNPQAMNPLSDVAAPAEGGGIFKHFAEQLNPLLKVGLEQATGQSIFTGKDFTYPDVSTGFGRERQFEINPETGTIEYLENGKRPNLLQHLLGQVPLVDTLYGGIAGGAAYSGDPTTAIPDPATGEPLYPTDGGLEMLKQFGLPLYDTNPEEYAQKLEEDRMAALQTWLSRNGY